MTPDELSELEDEGRSSMPGSFDDTGSYMPKRNSFDQAERGQYDEDEADVEDEREGDDSFDDDAIFDDDILATGEMKNVPF
jgi:phosphatidate phosphatase LPIN